IRRAWQHHLLSEPPVQDELKLSAGQKTDLRKVFQDIYDHRPGNAQAGARTKAAHRTISFVEEVKQHETEITTILSASQLRRLRQIALQRDLYTRGAAAFRDPEL